MKNWIVIGATSAIAEAVQRIWAARGYQLFLVARNEQRLQAVADDLSIRGAKAAHCYVMDVSDQEQYEPCLQAAKAALGEIDGLLIAHGTLPDQQACEASVELTRQEIDTNALSVISFCTLVANEFAEKKRGDIAVISSVAGDRGRPSNYVYGAAKGMVTTYLQGLRSRMCKLNVNVVTIKPGFVATPMTEEFDRSGPLWATPEQVASGIVKAIDKGKNVVYLPWFWWGIMTIIKFIPEFIFKKLSL